MTSRANIVAESAALVSNVKSLENQRRDLKDRIKSIEQRIGDQKRQAELISAVMKRDELPSLEDTQNRVDELRKQIEENRQKQIEFKTQAQDLQAQIDFSIAVRSKKTQYEKLSSDIRSLAAAFDAEKQRESDLKLKQTNLSSELLKAHLKKKQMEEKLTETVEAPPDVSTLQKKRQALVQQTKLVKQKREVFEQELYDAEEKLSELQDKQNELVSMANKIEEIDPMQLQLDMLEMAAENMDLRVYKPLTDDTSAILEEIHELEESCAALIEKCYEVIP